MQKITARKLLHTVIFCIFASSRRHKDTQSLIQGSIARTYQSDLYLLVKFSMVRERLFTVSDKLRLVTIKSSSELEK